MTKRKKAGFLALGILLCCLCALAVKEPAFASGLTGEEASGGNYLYDKYPIEHYMLDSYVDTSGNWLPWNWGKGLDDGAYSILAYFVGSLYVSIFKAFHVIGYFVEAVYSTDVIEPLMSTVVKFVQGIAGFNGSFLSNGLFPQLFAVVVVLTGLYYGFQIIRGETGRTLGGVSVFCLLSVVALGFFMNADSYIRGVNDIADSVQSVVVKAGTDALGMDGDPAAAIREGFFDITVYQPYLLLQYNDNTVSEERAGSLLALESGSEEREELVQEEVEEKGNEMMNGWKGLSLRMSNMLPLVASGTVLAVILLMMVATNIYHQFMFLLYVCLSPFILILSLLPGKAQMAVRLGTKILYELCMRVAIAMLICLMYGFSSAIYTITGTEGYLYGAVLQAILYVVIFLFRKKIWGFFKEGKTAAKGGFRSMVGSFYMANKGFKTLGALMGGKAGGRKASPGPGNSRAGAFRMPKADFMGTQKVHGLPENSSYEARAKTKQKGKTEENANAYTRSKEKQNGRTAVKRSVMGLAGKGMERARPSGSQDMGVSRPERRSSLRKAQEMLVRTIGLANRAGRYRAAVKGSVPSVQSSRWRNYRKIQEQRRDTQAPVYRDRRQDAAASTAKDSKGKQYEVRQKRQKGARPDEGQREAPRAGNIGKTGAPGAARNPNRQYQERNKMGQNQGRKGEGRNKG